MTISVYVLACYSLLTSFHLTDYLALGNKEDQVPGQGHAELLVIVPLSGAVTEL